MKQSKAHPNDPNAQDPLNQTTSLENTSDFLDDGFSDDTDDFVEFGKYAQMAAGARIKGAGPKGHGISKMRTLDDLRGAKKLHKPEHKPKREM